MYIDMEKDIWFKNKSYGWGWTPSNAKGWVVLLIYVALMATYPQLCKQGVCEFSLMLFLGIVFILSTALIAICYAKGEKPEWRWGDKK